MAIYDIHGNPIAANNGGYDWAEKVMSIEGDSHVANGTTAFPQYMASQLGVNTLLIGIAGVPVYGNYAGTRQDFRRRVSNIPANVDLIFIEGDSNAINSNVSDLNSTDISTWSGRWNVAVEAIKKSFPTVPVILASDYPHNRTGLDRTWHAHEQFERMAVRHGCYHISIGRDAGFSRIYANHIWGLFDGDTTGHCSNEAMKIWSDCVLQKIRSIKPPVWTGEDSITIDSTATLSVGNTANIGYTITGDQSIQWTSSDMDVACVMGGTVYGMSAGTATITATTRNGNTAACAVTVTSA